MTDFLFCKMEFRVTWRVQRAHVVEEEEEEEEEEERSTFRISIDGFSNQ